jgi:hypothetical protein
MLCCEFFWGGDQEGGIDADEKWQSVVAEAVHPRLLLALRRRVEVGKAGDEYPLVVCCHHVRGGDCRDADRVPAAVTVSFFFLVGRIPLSRDAG